MTDITLSHLWAIPYFSTPMIKLRMVRSGMQVDRNDSSYRVAEIPRPVAISVVLLVKHIPHNLQIRPAVLWDHYS
jgi:hypothetical protein